MFNGFQCVIDLARGVLRIGTTGTETPFLMEADLPECARLSGNADDETLGKSLKEMEESDLQRAIADSARASNPAPPDGTFILYC